MEGCLGPALLYLCRLACLLLLPHSSLSLLLHHPQFSLSPPPYRARPVSFSRPPRKKNLFFFVPMRPVY